MRTISFMSVPPLSRNYNANRCQSPIFVSNKKMSKVVLFSCGKFRMIPISSIDSMHEKQN